MPEDDITVSRIRLHEIDTDTVLTFYKLQNDDAVEIVIGTHDRWKCAMYITRNQIWDLNDWLRIHLEDTEPEEDTE